MQRISRADLPKEFTYYRSSDVAFLDYIKRLNWTNFTLVPISDHETGWVKTFFDKKIAIARFEKVNTEPSIERLRSMGISHGVMIWTSWSTKDIPDGWKKIPTYIAKNLIESTRMGWSRIVSDKFFETWKASAKWTRKKAHRLMQQGIIQVKQVDSETWGKSYRKSMKKFHSRTIYEQAQQYMSKEHPQALRHYLAFVEGKPLWGILMLDQRSSKAHKVCTTTYFAAFLEEDGKPYCLGTALIDRAMYDSFHLGIKYFNFDHFRDRWQVESFQGFTDFKEKIAQYDTVFEDMWVRYF